MEENIQPDWNLAAKYFAGETSTTEEAVLKAWLQADPLREEEFRKMSDSWTFAMQQEALHKLDEDKAWLRLKSKIAESKKPKKSVGIYRVLSPALLKTAAAIAILFVLAVAVYFLSGIHSPHEHMLTATNELNQPSMVKLPDGSIVTLNTGSKLEYSASMNGSLREVRLEGEAFFEVKHDPSRPFLVHSEHAIIRVVGTAFDVAAYRNSPEVKVMVESGKVELFSDELAGNKILLEKGSVGTLVRNSQALFKTENKDLNYLSWKTRVMHFDRTPLPEVVNVLNRSYHTQIELNSDELKTLSYTGTYTDESVDTIIDVLAKTFRLEIIRTGEKIELSGKGH